jgi:hypothetical protein
MRIQTDAGRDGGFNHSRSFTWEVTARKCTYSKCQHSDKTVFSRAHTEERKEMETGLITARANSMLAFGEGKGQQTSGPCNSCKEDLQTNRRSPQLLNPLYLCTVFLSEVFGNYIHVGDRGWWSIATLYIYI